MRGNPNRPQMTVLVPKPEIQQMIDELETNVLKSIYPLTRTPLLPYQKFQKSLYAPAIDKMALSSLPIIPEDNQVQQPQPKIETQYLNLFAFAWVSTYVVIGAFYTGLTCLYTTFPFMLRFAFANLGCLFFFVILAINEFYKIGFQEFKLTVKKYKTQKNKIFLTILFYTVSQISYVFPVKYTTIAQNNLFAQCASICIVFWKIFACIPTHILAIIGATLGLLGGAITILDNDEVDQQFTPESMAFGNFLSLLGAACAAAFTINTYSFMKDSFPLAIFSTILTIVCTLSGVGLCFLFESSQLEYIEWNQNVFWITVLVGFDQWLSQFAVYKSLELVSPLLFSTACLMQFPIAALQAWLMGMNEFPGFWIWIGGFVTIGGLFSIIKAEEYEALEKIEKIDKTASLLSAKYRKLN